MGSLAAPAVVRAASAQANWPSQPVRFVVGYAAGQSIDILARLIAQSLTEQFGQQVIVENRPGAGGNIAAGDVARAPADGATLLVVGANNPINSTLYDKLSFDLLRDFAAVAGIYRVYQVMVVSPSFPARTGAEFIAYAKANPSKINFGSAGTGSVAHVGGELFKMMAGIDMQHVPYRGAPLALADLLAGQVQVMFDNLPSSIDHVPHGPPARARCLDAGTASTQLPDAFTRSSTSSRASRGPRRLPRSAERHGRQRHARSSTSSNKAVGVALAKSGR